MHQLDRVAKMQPQALEKYMMGVLSSCVLSCAMEDPPDPSAG